MMIPHDAGSPGPFFIKVSSLAEVGGSSLILSISDLASLWWDCFVGSPYNDDFIVEIASSHLATMTL